MFVLYRNSQWAIAQQLKWRNFTWMMQIQFQHHPLGTLLASGCASGYESFDALWSSTLRVCILKPSNTDVFDIKSHCYHMQWTVEGFFGIVSLCFFVCVWNIFSGLTLLVGWQEGHLACKNWVVRYWRSYLSGARCKWFAYGPADATATPSSLAPVKSSMVYISGAGLPRLSWKKAVKWMY